MKRVSKQSCNYAPFNKETVRKAFEARKIAGEKRESGEKY
jgi:hypothetical protein